MTCLCLTHNRLNWLPKAIQCYQRQQYPNRELLIVSSGDPVDDILPADDPSVRCIAVEGCPPIGAKRNLGVEHARGEIICHWDDDDHSEPGRIADQVSRMIQTGKPVTGYSSMVFTNENGERFMYDGARDFALGTSLCYRADWARRNPFQSIQVGEDNLFVRRAWEAGAAAFAPANGLMQATIHAGNTSPRSLRGAVWSKL